MDEGEQCDLFPFLITSLSQTLPFLIEINFLPGSACQRPRLGKLNYGAVHLVTESMVGTGKGNGALFPVLGSPRAGGGEEDQVGSEK